MKAIADICIIPLGVGLSLSRFVAACEKIFQQRALKTHLHAYGTNVEGEWEDVMEALHDCHVALHEMGAPRVTTSIRLGTRNDRVQSLEDKIESVRSKLEQSNDQ